MSITASHSPLNISETVRYSGLVPTGNGPWQVEWSRDRLRHATIKSQTRDPNTLGSRKSLENSRRCYLAIISNNCWLL